MASIIINVEIPVNTGQPVGDFVKDQRRLTAAILRRRFASWLLILFIRSVIGHLVPSAFLYVIRRRGLQPELEPFPTRKGSLCFPEGSFQTTLITESMAQPALQHLSDPAVSGFTMA